MRNETRAAAIAGEDEMPQPAAIGQDILLAAGDAVSAEGTLEEERGEAVRGPVTAWLFRPDEPPHEVTLDEISSLITVEEYLVWIDLSEYAESELRQLAEIVHAHDRVVGTTIAGWSRPHVDLCTDDFSVSVTVPELDESTRRVVARQLNIIVGANYLISAHKQPLPFYREILVRASGDPDLVRLDSGFMLYILLDELLQYYEALQERMVDETEGMQLRALHDSSEAFLEDLLLFKRYTFALGQLAQHHESVFGAFRRPDFPFISGDELPSFFRDLQERLLRLIDRFNQMRQEVNNTFDIYISHQTHRTNNVMKLLTMVATVLFTATFIEGIFGPSFQRIPTHTVPGFILMLVLIVLASSTALYTFNRRGWL